MQTNQNIHEITDFEFAEIVRTVLFKSRPNLWPMVKCVLQIVKYYGLPGSTPESIVLCHNLIKEKFKLCMYYGTYVVQKN